MTQTIKFGRRELTADLTGQTFGDAVEALKNLYQDIDVPDNADIYVGTNLVDREDEITDRDSIIEIHAVAGKKGQ